MTKEKRIIIMVISMAVAFLFAMLNEYLIEEGIIVRGGFPNALLAYFIILFIVISSIFLVTIITNTYEMVTELLNTNKYVRALIVSISITFTALITYGILVSPFVNQVTNAFFFIILLTSLLLAIVIPIVLMGINNYRESKLASIEMTLAFDYSRLEKSGFHGLNNFSRGLFSFLDESLLIVPLSLNIPYKDITFTAHSTLEYDYNQLTLSFAASCLQEFEELSDIEIIRKYNVHAVSQIRFLLETPSIEIPLTYDLLFQLRSHNVVIPELDAIVTKTNDVLKKSPYLKYANYDFKFAKCLNTSRPSSIKEGYRLEKGFIGVNCSIDKIIPLFSNLIDLHTGSFSLIIAPFQYDSAAKTAAETTFYLLHDLTAYQVKNILEENADYMTNDGTFLWELRFDHVISLVVTPRKTILINSKSREGVIPILEKNKLYRQKGIYLIDEYRNYFEYPPHPDYCFDDFIFYLKQFGTLKTFPEE